jgi:hypothetical protein
VSAEGRKEAMEAALSAEGRKESMDGMDGRGRGETKM